MKKDDLISLIELGDYTEEEKQEMLDNRIEYRKQLSRIISKSKNDSKLDYCYYCERDISRFCNSHSIPRFCLKNIAVNGDVFYFNTIIKMPLMDEDKGINESGTFKIICSDCDSKIFKDYEDPNNYESKPTLRMLAQIAMKNYLRIISKRLNEISLYDNLSPELFAPKQQVNKLDLEEFRLNFLKAKFINEKNKGDYYLFYYRKLEYVVPLAFQGSITLISDFEGCLVNDIYYLDPKYKLQDIHICVFPLSNSSIVMMFVDSEYKRLRKFRKQFNALLPAINYIIFCYSEDIFLYKGLDKKIINNDMLANAAKKSTESLVINPSINPMLKMLENYNLKQYKTIPNLLLEEYRIM